MRIGVLCPAEIALRRFMPALLQCPELTFAGVGVYSKGERLGSELLCDEEFLPFLEKERTKAETFTARYGGRIYDSYEEMTDSPDMDALYIPLPPSLHYRWAKRALLNGKHVLVEKPCTVSAGETRDLVETASERGLAIHENYMFEFHSQLARIDELAESGEIGDVRLYQISFGFPMRSRDDFRYLRTAGGGALLDAGGYTIHYARRLLGSDAKVCYAQSGYMDGFEVDMYGSGALMDKKGRTAQIAFGMDNAYQCELKVWGSRGILTSGRVLTAPALFVPTARIRKENDETLIQLPKDDAFLKSIRHFMDCIRDEGIRRRRFRAITEQAQLVEDFACMAGTFHTDGKNT